MRRRSGGTALKTIGRFAYRLVISILVLEIVSRVRHKTSVRRMPWTLVAVGCALDAAGDTVLEIASARVVAG